MIEFTLQNAYLVAILPFISVFLLGFVTRKNADLSAGISIVSILISFFLSCLILYGKIMNYDVDTHGEYRWLTTGDFNLTVGWNVDNITAIMLVVVTFVSSAIQIYSLSYMEEYRERFGFSRYYGELSLFTFGMLALVLADNLLVLFAGWELVGVCSYLLIGYFFEKPEAASAAKKAFITTRVGDYGFIIGIMILFFITKQIGFEEIGNTLFHKLQENQVSGVLVGIAMILLFCGAIGKSAQFPLHVWLPDAMEGPTPVSALIHAATMVAAGVYMVAKLMGIFALCVVPINLFGIQFTALGFVGLIGGITAILAASIAITQNDIKRVLAYSTVSQLGFMMLSLGMYTTHNGVIHPIGYTAGVFHLMNHAFFKAMLFLCAGSVIHACHTNDMRKMGGLRKYMPITAITCLIGTASISGLPFITSGFWSKDEILAVTFEANIFLFGVAAIAAIMTTFYMFRLYFMTFEGEYRGDLHHHKPHESPIVMTTPLVILSILSISSGWIGTPWWNKFAEFIYFQPIGQTSHKIALAYNGVITASSVGVEHIAHHGPNWMLMGLSFLIFLIGFILAFIIYGIRKIDPEFIVKRCYMCYRISLNKFYFDEFYKITVNWAVLTLSKISGWFDKFFIDGIVNLVGLGTTCIGEVGKYSQTGKVQHYGFVIIIAVILIVVLMKAL